MFQKRELKTYIKSCRSFMGRVKTKKKITLLNMIAVILAFYVVFTFISQQFTIVKLDVKQEKTLKQLKVLKEEISDIEQKINKSDTPEYIEKIAREELDMAKPREIIYRDKNKQDS